jgi:hypothetical protein
MEDILTALRQYKIVDWTGDQFGATTPHIKRLCDIALQQRQMAQSSSIQELACDVEIIELLFTLLPTNELQVLVAISHLLRVPGVLHELRTHRKMSLDLAIRNLCAIFLEHTPVESLSCLSVLLLTAPHDRRATKVFSANSLGPTLSILMDMIQSQTNVICCCDVLNDIFTSSVTLPHAVTAQGISERFVEMRWKVLIVAQSPWDVTLPYLTDVLARVTPVLRLPSILDRSSSNALQTLLLMYWDGPAAAKEVGIVWDILLQSVPTMNEHKASYISSICLNLLQNSSCDPYSRCRALVQCTRSMQPQGAFRTESIVVETPPVETDIRIAKLSRVMEAQKEELEKRGHTLEGLYMKLVLLSKAFRDLQNKYETDVRDQVSEATIRARKAQDDTRQREGVIRDLQDSVRSLEMRLTKFSEITSMIHDLTGKPAA